MASRGSENGFWDWDLTTNRIHYSSNWISMLGWGGADFGNTCEEWFGRIHPEDSESVQLEIKAQIARGSTQFEIHHRMLHHDGCYRWMVCQGMISRDSSGQAVRITGFHLDKTDEKVVDALTGLPNRLLLLDRLARSIEKAKKRDDFIFAVLVVDLGLFESGASRLETVNTDTLVIAAARRLETALRSRDIATREGRAHLIARSGGEEFIVLLEGLTEISEAKQVAEKLLRGILAPFDFNGKEVFLASSIGIALSATRYRDPEAALRDADTALYRAKSFGKSRCEVFDTAALEATRSHTQLETEIQRALLQKEFVVHYQPIISLPTNQVAGFEALVRWQHPSRGMVPPMDFIPIAERAGLIVPLDRQILEEACSQLKIWKKNPRTSKDLWVSVNLSTSQFEQPSLVQDIQSMLRETGLDASSLVLELTEGAVMGNPEAARNVLMQLRVMGIRIGLDDFGTGYSSLAYLRRFPLDYLKVDRSFVRNIETNADTLEITRTITLLSQQLGLHVIAEGIENSRQLAVIRSLGCEYGQGFLFSKAVEARQAEQYLVEGFAQSNWDQNLDTNSDSSGSNPAPAVSTRKKLSLITSRKYFLSALTMCALLVLGTVLAQFNRSQSAQHSNPTSVPATVKDLRKPAPKANLAAAKPPSLPENALHPEVLAPIRAELSSTPTQNRSRKKTPQPAAVAYSFPVIHDHVLGSCEGILSFTTNGISFTSAKGKDSFSYDVSQCSYALDRDQLVVKAEKKAFRFKSATARNKDENRSQLSDIYQSISRLYEQGPKQASASTSK